MTITDEFTTIRPNENSPTPDELKMPHEEYLSKDCTWYSSQADLENLIFALDVFLKDPRSKFSKRYPYILKMREQFNGVLKRP